MSYRSSARDFDELVRSTVWEDILREMDAWLEDIHEELEDSDRETPDKVLHRLGGAAQAIRRFKAMPEVIRDNIKDDLGE